MVVAALLVDREAALGRRRRHGVHTASTLIKSSLIDVDLNLSGGGKSQNRWLDATARGAGVTSNSLL